MKPGKRNFFRDLFYRKWLFLLQLHSYLLLQLYSYFLLQLYTYFLLRKMGLFRYLVRWCPYWSLKTWKTLLIKQTTQYTAWLPVLSPRILIKLSISLTASVQAQSGNLLQLTFSLLHLFFFSDDYEFPMNNYLWRRIYTLNLGSTVLTLWILLHHSAVISSQVSAFQYVLSLPCFGRLLFDTSTVILL